MDGYSEANDYGKDRGDLVRKGEVFIEYEAEVSSKFAASFRHLTAKEILPPRPGALPLDHAGGSAPILPLYPYPSHSVLAMWLTQPMNTFHAPVSHDLKASL